MANLTSQNLRILAALLSGFFVALGFPGEGFPYLSAGFLLPIAYVPLFVAIDSLPKAGSGSSLALLTGGRKPITAFRRFRSAFLLTWLSGIVTVSIAFYWCTFPAILFGGIPPAGAYPAFGLYAILSGLFFPTMLFPFLLQVAQEGRRHSSPLPLLPLALLATALEVWTPRFFHWSLGSLMHSSTSVSQVASVFGFSGITFFILLSNALLARALTDRSVAPMRSIARMATVAAMWLTIVGWGHWRIARVDAELKEQGRTSHIGLIQPNYTFNELSSNPTLSSSAQKQSLSYLLELSEELLEEVSSPLDLLVWPESVAPSRFASSEEQLNRTKDLAEKHNTPILVQATEFDAEEVKELGYRRATIFSTSFLLRPDRSRSPSYRKWIPIPFGESVPFEHWFPWLGDFVRDHVGNTSKVGRGNSSDALPFSPLDAVAPLICFDAIDLELPRLQTREGGASLFVNQSNFVWMGRSNAGYQFKELVRFRAIENGRSAVLAANTGPSAIVDPLGRDLIDTTTLLKPAQVSAHVPISNMRTLFTFWGQWPLHIGGLLSFLVILYSTSQGSRKKPGSLSRF